MDIIGKLGLNQEMVENMSAGAFNNKSYFGYKGKILKSGICKYYRRKQFDKFEWCVIEMMLFGLKNKGLLTNVINRIKILLMEEIVCTEFGKIVYCVNILNIIDKPAYELDKKIVGMLEICHIIKEVRRARIVSYVNCWWRFNTLKYDFPEVILYKVEQFKKKNDSEELLKYGELFINFMENHDEKMMDIFHKLYNKTGTYGTRYRRKDAVFLIFEIIENKYKSNKDFMVVFEFIKNMFFRKGMNERRAFGVWLIIIVWKFKTLDFKNSSDIKKLTNEELEIYMKSRTKISINESYVVKDYHISKSFGLDSFGNEGSKVIGEDLRILGENGTKYRQLYVDDKNGKIKPRKTITLFAGDLSKNIIAKGIKRFITQKNLSTKTKNTTQKNLSTKQSELNFSGEHSGKYLKGYIHKKPKKYDTLDNAKKNAVNFSNVGGITHSKKTKFTLRKGKILKDSPSGESSWLTLDTSHEKPGSAEKSNSEDKTIKKTKKRLVFRVKPSLPIVDNKTKGLLKYFKIKTISIEEINKILELPQGQKLTSSSKKSVYVGKTHVYKGPFTEDDKKLTNSIRFTLALKLLEDISSIPYRMKSLLMFEIRQRGVYYFIVSKNIGENDAIDENKSTIVDTTLLSKSLTEMKKNNGNSGQLSKKIKIYPRGVIKRINDIINLYPDKFTDDIKTATLQHLYFRFLLNIGDSGPQNVLYREDNSKQLVAGIDMEEIRGKDQGATQLEYLFNSRYNKKVALFRDSIDTIKTISYDNIKKHSEMFKELGIDIENIRQKIDKFDSSTPRP